MRKKSERPVRIGTMPKVIPYDPNQSKMVVINYTDQLQPGAFEFAILYFVENNLDLSVFYPRYQNDENGRPAYDPALLLKTILFAYFKGITSSREIQWCCETNILFKVLACDQVPHFTTLAAFVSEGQEHHTLQPILERKKGRMTALKHDLKKTSSPPTPATPTNPTCNTSTTTNLTATSPITNLGNATRNSKTTKPPTAQDRRAHEKKSTAKTSHRPANLNSIQRPKPAPTRRDVRCS